MVIQNFRKCGAIFSALREIDWRAGCVSAAVLITFGSAAHAQTQLNAYVDAKGYLNVRTLTCAQLAGTFQEDAELLGVWYSGWINGQAKRHFINVDRTRAGIHDVIVNCKANPNMTVVDAVKAYVKQQGGK